MRLTLALTLAILYLVLPTEASAELKVTGPKAVKPFTFVKLKAEGAKTGAGFLWNISPDPGKDAIYQSKGFFAFTGAPGTYQIRLDAIKAPEEKGGDTDVESARWEVTIEGGPPPVPPPVPPGPGPGPGPNPPVPPTPVARAWVLVIEETAEATARRGSFYGNRELVDYVKAKGWRIRPTDKDARDRNNQTPSDIKPYLDLVTKSGLRLPYTWVVAQDGTVRHQGELPSSPGELLAILRRIGG